jgi:hypothetical protein
MTSEEHMKRLLGAIGRLTQILREENDKLSQPGRAKGLKEIVAEKESASRVYEQHMKALGNGGTLKTVSPDLKKRLSEAAQTLSELMDENRRKLEVKMEAAKTLFKIIADAAKEYRAASGTYGNSGAVGMSVAQARKAYSPTVSVGVNREL